jgi:hypothetical protein
VPLAASTSSSEVAAMPPVVHESGCGLDDQAAGSSPLIGPSRASAPVGGSSTGTGATPKFAQLLQQPNQRLR